MSSNDPDQLQLSNSHIGNSNKMERLNDKELDTCIWPQFEMDCHNQSVVSALKCSVCMQYEEKLRGCKNFTSVVIVGSKNVRSSAFKEHADSDMHKRAMILFQQAHSTHVSQYAPIAKALTTIDPETEAKLKKIFDLVLWQKKNLAFKKFASLTALEERHGVELGANYKNKNAAAMFVDYISRAYC